MDPFDAVTLDDAQGSLAETTLPLVDRAYAKRESAALSSPAAFYPDVSDQTRVKSSKERLRLRLYFSLLCLDLGSILAGFSVASLLRFGDFERGPGPSLALGSMPVFLALAFSGSCYSIEVLASPFLGIRRTLKALVFTVAALLIALYSAKTAGGVSRIVFALGLMATASILGVSRLAFGRLWGRAYGWSFRNEVLLVDGVDVHPAKGQIVVFASHLGVSPMSNDPGQFTRLGRLLANCDSVMLATLPDRRAAWAATLKSCGIAVEVLAPELSGLGALRLRESHGGTALLVSVGPLGLRERLLKRSFDVVISVCALIIAAPLFMVIAVAIKTTSRGPIFFRQPRLGEGNRVFEVLKFRTMRVEASDHPGARSTSRGDDRITSVGRMLRKVSLDELPQLLNVVSGSMSLVGPRPHALASKAGERLFWDADQRYWQRGAVRPGITGLAQVRGFRGSTLSEQDLVNRVQSDLDYLLDWSIWRDLGILVRTAKVMIHPNAY